jgi:hypothetical protein
MLPLLAELTTEPRTADNRGAVRRTLRLEVQALSSLNTAKALIRNLSERGLLIETTASLALGETIQVDLPEAGSCEARIVWNDGPFFGCEFTTPVSKAAVSAALLLAPVEQPPVNLLPDMPAQAVFGESQARHDDDFNQEPRSRAMDITLMASLVFALLMVVIFIYALLTFQFSN